MPQNIGISATETQFPDPLSKATIRNDLSRSNRKDDYIFTLSKLTKFRSSLKGIQRKANVNLFLRDENNKLIAKSKKPGNKNEKINIRELEAGTYTLSSKLKGRNATNYKLKFKNKTIIPKDFAGNSIPSARVISVGTTPSSYRDYVDADDPADFYRFTVGNASSPSATLDMKVRGVDGPLLDDDVNVILRDASGNQVTQFATSGSGEASQSRIVERGTYYIEVEPRFSNDSTRYNLVLSATPIIDTAGNSLPEARTVTLGSSATTIQDFVGTGDEADFFRFTVGNDTFPSVRFKAMIEGVGGGLLDDDVTVTLRDNLGNQVTSLSTSSGGGQTLERTLGQGTYYAVVEPRFSNDSTPYNLKLSADLIEDTAGETSATARPLFVSSTPTVLNEFVGEGDRIDYYSFTVTGTKTVDLTVSGVGGNLLNGGLRLSIRDNLDNQVPSGGTTASSGSGGTSLTPILTSGTYFVRVEPRFTSDRDVDYTLELSARNVV